MFLFSLVLWDLWHAFLHSSVPCFKASPGVLLSRRSVIDAFWAYVYNSQWIFKTTLPHLQGWPVTDIFLQYDPTSQDTVDLIGMRVCVYGDRGMSSPNCACLCLWGWHVRWLKGKDTAMCRKQQGLGWEENSARDLRDSVLAVSGWTTIPTQHSMDPNAETPVLLMLAESVSVIFQHVVMHKNCFPRVLSLIYRCDMGLEMWSRTTLTYFLSL